MAMQETFPLKIQQSVPKLFKVAAKILKLVKENGASVKTLVYDTKYKHNNIPALFALVSEANKKWDLLEKVIEITEIFQKNPKLNPWLGRILIVDIMRGKSCKSECRPVLCVQQYTDVIRKTIAANTDIKKDKLRYVRVNTLKTSIENTIKWFQEVECWKLLIRSKTYKDHLRVIEEQLLPKLHVFIQDFHIPEVLVFPSGHENYFYQLGLEELVLQNKASCLDVFLLKPEKESIVLDMCAAPGMKTSHLAAVLENTGKIYAVERDFKRFKTLQDMLQRSGATNVKTIKKDVSQVGAEMCPGVEYIILDPSCSGSGLSDRTDRIDATRLQRLRKMQFALLRHALTSFPNVKRVLYSTCSTHTEENEEVIQSALDKIQHDFHLVDLKPQLPGWVSFGSDKYSFGSKCIYARPDVDRTTGFFVAVFEKKCKDIYTEVISPTKKRKKLKISDEMQEMKTNIMLNNKSVLQNFVGNGSNAQSKHVNQIHEITDSGLPEDSKHKLEYTKIETKNVKTKNRLKRKK